MNIQKYSPDHNDRNWLEYTMDVLEYIEMKENKTENGS